MDSDQEEAWAMSARAVIHTRVTLDSFKALDIFMSSDTGDGCTARPGKGDYPHLSSEKQKEELISLLARSQAG